MGKNSCPICGKSLDDSNIDFLDNGSPAHPQCVALEEKYEKEKDKGDMKDGK